MDYLSGKLKESININKQNNKFKQVNYIAKFS